MVEAFPELIKKAKDYLERGYYKKADSLYQQAATIQEKYAEKNNLNYAEALNGRGEANLGYENYKESAIFLEEALNLQKKLAGNSSYEYAATLSNLGWLQFRKQEYDSATNLSKRSAEIIKKVKGENSYEYATSIGRLGYCYVLTQKTGEARKLFIKASEICKRTKGDTTAVYSEMIARIGLSFLYEGNYSSAEYYYLQAVEIDKKAKEPHPYNIDHIIGLTDIYGEETKNFRLCIQLLQKAQSIYNLFFHGYVVHSYADIQANMGGINAEFGDYDKAIPLLEESIRIIPDIYGVNHQTYANALSALAFAYQETKRFDKAESLYLQSLHIREKIHGKTSPEVALLLVNLGNFYYNMGVTVKALDYYINALKTVNEILKKNGQSEKLAQIGAKALKGLAFVSEDRGDLESALSSFQQVSDLEKSISDESLSYLLTEGDIIRIHQQMNYKVDSIAIEYEVLLQKIETLLGKNHFSYITTLNNLACFYFNNLQYSQAIKTYKEALNLIENQNENYYFEIYIKLLMGIGMTYEAMKEPENVIPYYNKMIALIKEDIKNRFDFLSELEREDYWSNSISFRIYYMQNFLVQHSDSQLTYNADFPSLLYDNELITKSVLLSSTRHVQQTIQYSGNDELIENWNNYCSLKEEMIRLQSPSVNPFERSTQVNQLEELEKKLIRDSWEFNLWKNELNIDWKMIQHVLDKQDAAIEFVESERYDQGWTGEKSYSALVLRPDMKTPVLIKLCKETELKLALSKSQQDPALLYKLIWEPIENTLFGVKDVYLAPAGLLNQVSFAGIKKDTGHVCDEWVIHNLLSTRDIIKIKNQPPEANIKKRAVLFGGIDYGQSSIESNPSRGQGFAYLSGSQKEVELINKQLIESDWKTKLFTGSEATKTQLKSFSTGIQSSELIHISTHGFYFPYEDEGTIENNKEKTEKKNSYRTSPNPLMRVGLAFAGANFTWKGKGTSKSKDDGILTAYEISNMNLDNTDLVVLSACETAMGETVYIVGEGVYGLQRAFKLAGVHTMIVSLWEVPDKETEELMTEFYSQWTHGLSKKKAFTQAQLKLRSMYPEQPEKWAGFIMIE